MIRKYFKTPLWQVLIGTFILLGASIFTARIIWEQTVLTWRSGLQMVGFSLIHGSYFFLVFFPLLLIIWLVVLIIYMVYRLVKKLDVYAGTLSQLAWSVVILILLFIPYRFWQKLFVDKFSKEQLFEFSVDAAADGDLSSLKTFMAKGVNSNDSDKEGITLMHAAAVNGKNEVISYLLSQGADPNRKNNYGHTPLDNAIEMKHPETAELLKKYSQKN